MKKFLEWNGFNRIRTYWQQTERVGVVEWSILGIILLFSLLTMSYVDLVETNYDAQRFLHMLFSKDFLSASRIISTSPYGISFFIVYAIGLFPLWIIGLLSPLRDFVMESSGAIIWMKCYLLLFVILIAREMLYLAKKIKVTKVNQHWMLFALFSSLFVVLPVFQVGQYDVICLFFILLGIRFYVEDRHWKFIAAFAFAIPMKYFALFIFIPLVLYRYKNFIRIAAECALGVSWFAFEKIVLCRLLPQMGDLLFAQVSQPSVVELAAASVDGAMVAQVEETAVVISPAGMISGAFSNLFEIQGEVGNWSVSVFVLAFFALCVACYLMKTAKDAENIVRHVICIGLAAYGAFFLFTAGWNSYWIVLIAPFLILFLFMKEENLRINLICEMVLSVGIVIGKMIDQSFVFGGQYAFTRTLLKDVPQRYMNVYYLIGQLKLDKYYSAVYAIVIVCVVTLVVVNMLSDRMREKLIGNIPSTSADADAPRVSRGWWWCRILVLLVLIFAEIDVAFWQ